MNIRDLEYLVALYEQRHFGRAAAACYVSQPTLSMQIKKLESYLGVSLIERSSRSVLFTATGEAVVERARSVLGEVRDIEVLAKRARNPRSGSVKLGVFPTLGPYLLPHVVQQLSEALPEVELLLVEEKTADLVAGLLSGSLDAIVVASPVPPDETGLVVSPLFTEPFDLAVPAGHRFAEGPVPSVSDALADEDVLLLEDGHCLRDQALEVCHSVGAQERAGFRATSLETLRYMVASGVGVTLLPRLATVSPVPVTPGLSVRPFAGQGPSRSIVLARRASSTNGELVEEMAEVVRREVGKALEKSAAVV
ncbi:LysR substrate-binding domain-containing protein [Dermatophilus congolensis]|uniref:LysR substrate-binding domain-containing protein n=1 Tax=Dermatophilus congolensis TaxID=1863 RepID=UPI001AAF7E45|nr:LysR substrate-binding domain-containing protein [Dermatophilus congolensis]MBO3143110.1 LysR family transcriptional regulator [Dermatophilus congolensis]MBO3152096.1 LysR family transcriptional regulator [Dermatophilus congolensis]MBO3160891.1 LysR family transcriptional regulator [Dermatophilus congolensis]MBO3163384.1 LysR family transcriptional regulator [Dermatophilus congolensis]MBO3176934.1 LysR family transcriptional regulator [Dermatophilus congolensis]